MPFLAPIMHPCLQVARKTSVIIGALELGGSHVSSARLDSAGNQLQPSTRLPLDPNGHRSELLGAILEAARTLGDGLSHLGVAVPGPFDYEAGICTIAGVGKLEGLFGVNLRS